MSSDETRPTTASSQSPPLPMRPRPRGFWVFAALLTLFPAAASSPSPLYADYARRWHFPDSTLTVVFAVYAATLLLALLVFGGLSDDIGRKPVTLAAVALLAVSMVVFATAGGVGSLLAARALQGLATGLLTAVASAALLDLQPPQRTGLASLLGAALSTGGLGAGALLSGLLVQYAWSPSTLVYLVILGALGALGILVAIWADETVTPRVRPRIRVRVAVPPEARSVFAATIPCLVATWALISFYLSLGPELASTLSHTTSHLPGAASVALLTGLAASATIATRTWTSRTAMFSGCAILAAGSALTVTAITVASTGLFYASTAVAGIGFGLAFSGAYRSLVALAHPTERSALVAATYIVGYVAFAVPAVAAGVISNHIGLTHTAIGYSAAVAALALIGFGATSTIHRRPSTTSADRPLASNH